MHSILTLLVTCLLTTAPAFANGEGGYSGGGGDLRLISNGKLQLRAKPAWGRTRAVEKYIRKNLKTDLRRWLKGLTPRHIEILTADLPPEFQSIRTLLQQKLDEVFVEIERLEYIISKDRVYFQSSSADPVQEKDAVLARRGDPVRFNLERLARYDLKWDDLREALVQLGYHELVRQLGYRDDGNQLARMATRPFSSLNESLLTLKIFRPYQIPLQEALLRVTYETLPFVGTSPNELIRNTPEGLQVTEKAKRIDIEDLLNDAASLGLHPHDFYFNEIQKAVGKQGYALQGSAQTLFGSTPAPRSIQAFAETIARNSVLLDLQAQGPRSWGKVKIGGAAEFAVLPSLVKDLVRSTVRIHGKVEGKEAHWSGFYAGEHAGQFLVMTAGLTSFDECKGLTVTFSDFASAGIAGRRFKCDHLLIRGIELAPHTVLALEVPTDEQAAFRQLSGLRPFDPWREGFGSKDEEIAQAGFGERGILKAQWGGNCRVVSDRYIGGFSSGCLAENGDYGSPVISLKTGHVLAYNARRLGEKDGGASLNNTVLDDGIIWGFFGNGSAADRASLESLIPGSPKRRPIPRPDDKG